MKAPTTEQTTIYLSHIQKDIEAATTEIYTKVGAVMAYLNNDNYFVNEKFHIKDKTMNELIIIRPTLINGAEVNSVNARDLHAVLESKQDFSTWIKKRLDEVDAVENVDYIVFHKKMENLEGGRPQVEYILSTDIAKEIAMMERNEKGKQVRRYFIEVEKAYKRDKVAVSQLDYMQMQLNLMKEHDERLAAIEQKRQKDERRFKNLENTAKRDESLKEYTTAVGFGILKGVSLDKIQCQRLGTKAAKISRSEGVLIVTIPDQKHGKVGTYRRDILEQAFNELNFRGAYDDTL